MPGKGDLSLRLNSSSFPHSILWSPPNIWLGWRCIVISSKGRSRVWRREGEFQAHLGCTMNWIVDPILVRIKVLKCLLYNPQRLQPAILRESLSFFLYPAQNVALFKELQKEQTVTGNFCVHIWLCKRKHQEHEPPLCDSLMLVGFICTHMETVPCTKLGVWKHANCMETFALSYRDGHQVVACSTVQLNHLTS